MNVMLIRILLYFVLDFASYVIFDNGVMEPSMGILLVFTAIFVATSIFEIVNAKGRIMLLPPIIFSIYNIVNVHIGGIIFLEYGIGDWMNFPGDPYYVVLCALVTNIAIHCLWIGYYLVPELKFPILNKYKSVEIDKKYFAGAMVIAVLSFLIGIKTGSFGYLKDDATAGFSAYINYGVQIGYMCIIFLAFYDHNIRRHKLVLTTLLLVYFAIGIASASKTTFGMPLVYIMLSYYVKGKRINPAYFVLFLGVIVVSYGIIEPFRKLNQIRGDSVDYSDMGELYGFMIDAYVASDDQEISEINSSLTMQMLERQSYIAPMSMALEYADINNYYKPEEFKDILLSPFYAVIPRFLWPTKPQADFGRWFSYTVYGSTDINSIGITPQAYAYMVWRYSGIIIIFLLFGVIQKFLYELLFRSGIFFPIYILMILTIAYPSDLTWTFIAGIIKDIFVVWIPINLLLLKTVPPKTGESMVNVKE